MSAEMAARAAPTRSAETAAAPRYSLARQEQNYMTTPQQHDHAVDYLAALARLSADDGEEFGISDKPGSLVTYDSFDDGEDFGKAIL